jgi:hypothetical protein
MYYHFPTYNLLIMQPTTRFFTGGNGDKPTFKTFLPTFEGDIVMPFGEYLKSVYGVFF